MVGSLHASAWRPRFPERVTMRFPVLPRPLVFRRLLLLAAAPAVVLLAASAGGAATLPTGFVELQVGGALTNPTSMALTPGKGNRIFVTEQGGTVRVIKTRTGKMLAAPFLTLSVDSNGERGLLGLAFDPLFNTNHFVYVYYTVPSPAHNRISRFTANGNVVVPGSEVVLLDIDNLSTATNHNGGALHFGADGKLYASTGDNARGSTVSQTSASLLGKILRINSDGTIPQDNPFAEIGKNKANWAIGLRNPYTFEVQPGTGRIFINDVGENTWEEIDDGLRGANYGWQTAEGPNPPGIPNFTYPLYYYPHNPACAITGGSFYNPRTAQFPASFVGTYFFADLCAGWMQRFDPVTSAVTPFATGISAPVDIDVAPDGSLYYLRGAGRGAGQGAVFRVRYPNKDTIGVRRPSTDAYLLRNTNTAGSADVSFVFGVSGDQPIAGDWNGDGVDTVGSWRPSEAAFYLRNSNTQGGPDIGPIQFGQTGDIPLVGDWNGDGVDTIGVYRPSTATFYLRNTNTSGAPDLVINYGAAPWPPVVGDWDGDGVDTIGVYDPSAHTFLLRNSNSPGAPDIQFTYSTAVSGDVPITGDWDGDGITTVGVFRPSTVTFYLRNANTTGTNDMQPFAFGAAGDLPITGNWDGH